MQTEGVGRGCQSCVTAQSLPNYRPWSGGRNLAGDPAGRVESIETLGSSAPPQALPLGVLISSPAT